MTSNLLTAYHKTTNIMTKFITSILLFLSATGIHAQSIYNIKEYGATNDTTVLSTKAIQRAIDDCYKNGGGVVWVPAGNYLSTAIVLKDNVTLHLDAGSTLYASRQVNDYKEHKIEVGASDTKSIEVLIMALNAKNISITGTGTLHCQAVREQYRREPQLEITDFITGREIANAAKYGVDYQMKYRKVPPCPGAINFTGCTNVHIRDIQVIESSFWSVHLQWCDRVFVDGIHIQSSGDDGVNSDGLDVDGCSNVLINNCIINTGDDALCLKTTLQNGKTMPCKWITISNCILNSSSAAFKIGTESHADFTDITVTNCVVNNANRGLNMIIRDGGSVRNITFTNIIMNTIRKKTFWWGNGDAVWLTTQARLKNKPSGNIENITFNHIIAHGQSGVRIEGFDAQMKNIRFNDFQLFMEPENAIDKRSRNGFLFNGIDKLSMIDCEVNWNTENPENVWESAYYFENINGLNLIRAYGTQAPNKKFPSFRYKDVKAMKIDGNIIQNSSGEFNL